MEITKWEYLKDMFGESELNELGKKGWEVCGCDKNGCVILKRPCGRIQVVEKVNGVEVNRNNSNEHSR